MEKTNSTGNTPDLAGLIANVDLEIAETTARIAALRQERSGYQQQVAELGQ